MIVSKEDQKINSDEKYKKKVTAKIKELQKKRNAIILAHNYQRDEIQDIADVRGDSLALARAAKDIQQETIVFCGVLFMAESAAILNPEKLVLLPVREAGCPLAEMATVEKLRQYRVSYPDAAVVCYVNSAAEIKAESDICCTSSNAIKVVQSLPQKRVIFLPDRNLARYVAQHVPEKEIIIWPGFCITHMRVTEEEVLKAKKEHPEAALVAHPECEPEVLRHADCVTSTGGMFSYIKSSPKNEFIITTEQGMLYGLKKENPDKLFFLPSKHLICANMKLTTLGWVLNSLETLVYEVQVDTVLREKARGALDRMLAVT
ncbi:MAG: quinolinate synthase NadA [Candidatus Omnitrophica bacterium]|nr:quinolinate synthase NadA [Candidatus Omnitrophota bacterium]